MGLIVIMVTGGAGFIGSHITDQLLAGGHQVIVIDDLSTGKLTNVNARASFYKTDICDPGIENIFKEEQPEIVLHHAAQVNVQKSISNPAMDANVNILGSLNMLENCVRHGVKKFIYASSAAVYGQPQYLGIDELHPIAPVSFYGVSKYTAENYVKTFAALYGLQYTILRYANVYGPRQDTAGEGGVISIFLHQLINQQTPIIFGDGEQTRDFIFVHDVVTANIRALYLANNETINVSTNQQTSLNHLAKLIAEVTGTQISPDYANTREGDIYHSYLDNSRARQLLLWKPAYSLRQGLARTRHSMATPDKLITD